MHDALEHFVRVLERVVHVDHEGEVHGTRREFHAVHRAEYWLDATIG
ncbi:MAG: hypothetical protein ABIT36_05340 [Steroidobacteraceae bacterium]